MGLAHHFLALFFVAVSMVLVPFVGSRAQSLSDEHRAFLRLYNEGRHVEAEAPGKRALELAERQYGIYHLETAEIANRLGLLYRNLGRYAKAEPLHKRALAIREKALGPDHAEVGASLNDLGYLYWNQGRYGEAEPLHKRALAIREKAFGRDHANVGTSLNNLGLLYWNLGRYAEAEPLHKRALAIREKAFGPEHVVVSTSLNNLGILYRDQGRYAEAEPILKRALAIREKTLGPEHADVGLSLNNLANLYRLQGRYAEAEPYLKRALAIREKARGPEHADVGASLSSLGIFYRDQGRYAEAEPLLKRALAIREKALGPEHADVGGSLSGLGILYRDQSRYAEAEPLLKRALAIREKALGADHPVVAQSAANLARLYEKQGHFTAALPLARRATAMLRQREIAGDERTGGEPALGARPERHVLITHLSIAGRAAASRPEDTFALAAEALEVAQLASVSSAGQALARTAARYSGGDGTLVALVRERQDAADRRVLLDEALIAAVSKPPAQRDADREQRLRGEIGDIRRTIDKIDTRLRREFFQFAELSRPQPLPLKEAQALLAPDEALLAFTVVNDATYRFVLRKDRADFRRIEVKKADLSSLVAAVRASVEVSSQHLPRFDGTKSHELYNILLASAAPMLAGASRLLIVPDGPLMGLPFSILMTTKPPAGSGDFGDYRRMDWLMRQYAIAVLPTVGSLKALRVLAQRGGRAPLPFAGFGDPILQGQPGAARGKAALQLAARGDVADVQLIRQFEPLPESAGELGKLAKALRAEDSTVFVRGQATERRVKSMDLSKYRVLAFATHAIMAGEFKGYGEPALVLTPPVEGDQTDDGLLGASEVAQLKLNADWVVLSACNTAAPDGSPGAEGLSGLARAFFYAGSRALLVSHWPVVSDAAVRLSTGAFDALAKEPAIGRAEALRRSMLALLDDASAPAHFAHPAVWAPFSLVGEGGAGR